LELIETGSIWKRIDQNGTLGASCRKRIGKEPVDEGL
jgi:hypothetical protein